MNNADQLRILIIEDEPILAIDLSETLEAEGYYVVGIANNGRKALNLFQSQPVDLILCDIMIKGDWDGIETVRQLTAERTVPVIYLTALTDRDTLTRAKQTFPAAYLNKPWQLPSLRAAIELAIQNATLRALPPPVERDTNGREALLQINNYLYVKQNYQFVRMDMHDILYLEADNTHTKVVTSTRKYIMRLTLSHLLERVNQSWLVRVHRSYAVNINFVESFSDVEVSVGSQLIPLSRGYKDDFMRHFLHR